MAHFGDKEITIIKTDDSGWIIKHFQESSVKAVNDGAMSIMQEIERKVEVSEDMAGALEIVTKRMKDL